MSTPLPNRCPLCVRAFSQGELVCPDHQIDLVQPKLEVQSGAGPLTGMVIDRRYVVGRQVGEGGMGSIYEGECVRLGYRVAIKVLRNDLSRDPKMRVRFFREMRVSSLVQHPNIVGLIDFGEDATFGAYLVMEFLDGVDLATYLHTHKRIDVTDAFRYVLQIAVALDAIHRRGLIHRDIKPGNIQILPSGQVKVLDLGLAKAFLSDMKMAVNTLTTAGFLYGTPWYMSPEQAAMKPLDHRSDIYSLGVVFYQMIVGIPPFNGETPIVVIDAHRNQPVPLPRRVQPAAHISLSLEMLLLKSLEKDPNDRQQTISDFIEELHCVAQEMNLELQQPLESSYNSSPFLTVASEESSGPRAGVTSLWPMVPKQQTTEFLEFDAATLDAFTNVIYERINELVPEYRGISLSDKKEAIRMFLQAAIAAVNGTDPALLPDEIMQLIQKRTEQGFSLIDWLAVLFAGSSSVSSIVWIIANEDPKRFLSLSMRIEERLVPFILSIVRRFFEVQSQQIVQLNETLLKRNVQLQKLQSRLVDEVRETRKHLARNERLKAMVTDAVNTGLALFDHQSRSITFANKAMERFAGIPAEQALGCSIDELLEHIGGIPEEEFSDQIRQRGEIGARKLRVSLPNGQKRSWLVRGQPFQDTDNKEAGTLFVVEDVTEQDRIVDHFRRYVSKDVSKRVMRNDAGTPTIWKQTVAIVACRFMGCESLGRDADHEAILTLWNDVVTCCCNVLETQGGVLDAIEGETALMYFTKLAGSVDSVIDAAIHLFHHWSLLQSQHALTAQVGMAVGIDYGECLFLHVGNQQRMIVSPKGEPVLVARALAHRAKEGELLVSQAAKAHSVAERPFEKAILVDVEGASSEIQGYRCMFDATVSDEVNTWRDVATE